MIPFVEYLALFHHARSHLRYAGPIPKFIGMLDPSCEFLGSFHKHVFTLGVRDSSVEFHNTMLVI